MPEISRVINRLTQLCLNTPYLHTHPRFISSRRRNRKLDMMSFASRARYMEANFELKLNRGEIKMGNNDGFLRPQPARNMSTRDFKACIMNHLSMKNSIRRIVVAMNNNFKLFNTIEMLSIENDKEEATIEFLVITTPTSRINCYEWLTVYDSSWPYSWITTQDPSIGTKFKWKGSHYDQFGNATSLKQNLLLCFWTYVYCYKILMLMLVQPQAQSGPHSGRH